MKTTIRLIVTGLGLGVVIAAGGIIPALAQEKMGGDKKGGAMMSGSKMATPIIMTKVRKHKVMSSKKHAAMKSNKKMMMSKGAKMSTMPGNKMDKMGMDAKKSKM